MAKSGYPAMLWNADGRYRIFNMPDEIPKGEDWRDTHPRNWPVEAPAIEPVAPTKRRPVTRLNAPE